MKRYSESVKLALAGITPEDTGEPSEMFDYYAGRLLVGEKNEPLDDWLDEHLAGYEKTKRLNIDLTEMTYLAALWELSGKSGKKAARKGLSFLESSEDVDEEQHQTVESALALAFLTGDSKSIKRFSKAALNLPDNEKTLTFELLFLASFKSVGAEVLNRLADLTARAIKDGIWALPYFSAASHVCVLSAIAAEADKNVRDLLKNRLEKLDKVIFEKGDTPRLEFAQPDYRLEETGEKGARLTVRQKITGKGVLNTGAYELKEFTSHLRQTVETAAAEAKIRQTKARHSRAALLDRALESETGELRAVLDFGKDVELPPLDKELLEKRFDLGWKIAKSFNDKLRCRHKLEIQTPDSSKK